MAITLDQIDDIFTYHKWSPDQIAKGSEVRTAAKKLAIAIIESESDVSKAVDSSLAKSCRERALNFVRIAVQEANAAITFEAAELQAV
jgi:hypothetical protein